MALVEERIGGGVGLAGGQAGEVSPGGTVVVGAASGKAGISLAVVAGARGYRLIVTMREGASIERRRMLRLMDAQVELTPARLGMAGAIARANEILAETPDAWMPDQFNNPANPAVHAATTAEEIWTDTAGEVDVIVSGAGTGGTATGIAMALKPRRPGLQVFAVEPSESAVLNGDEPGPHGIQGIGPGFCPATLDTSLLDGVPTGSEREAIAAARRCARLDGSPVGMSSGAALHAAHRLASEKKYAGKTIVAIAPSFAERYLSTALFSGL